MEPKGRKIAGIGALLALAMAGLAVAQTTEFETGERLFRENKPKEAVASLTKAVSQPGVDERAWLYLALSYEQLGRYDDVIATLRRGLPQAVQYRHLFYYDMGNAFSFQGRNSFAEEMYGEAIGANGNYAPAYLNRANVRMSLRSYREAALDYGRYLELDPESSRRPAIEALLARLGTAFAEEDRIVAEAEAARLAAEAARQALLDQVAASLKAAAEETTNLSAGSGQVQGYGDALELDE